MTSCSFSQRHARETAQLSITYSCRLSVHLCQHILSWSPEGFVLHKKGSDTYQHILECRTECIERARKTAHHGNLAIDADDDDCVERGSGAEQADHVSVPPFRPHPIEQSHESEADDGLVQAVEHPDADFEGAEIEVPLALRERKSGTDYGRWYLE